MEVLVTVKSTFPNEDRARDFEKKLKASARRHKDDLGTSMAELAPLQVIDEIVIERVSRKRSIVRIDAYSGRIDPPIWFVHALCELGAERIDIREQYDEGGQNYYFVGDKRTSRAKYNEAGRADRPLSPKERESRKGLFLPEGRVKVKAKLIESYWDEGNYGEFCVMKLETEDGKPFVYRGNSETLTKMTFDEFDDTCEFTATFEYGKLEGKPVSFAKRPSKVVLARKKR